MSNDLKRKGFTNEPELLIEPTFRITRKRIKIRECPNPQIREKAQYAERGGLTLLLEARHPEYPNDSTKVLRCYMIETMPDFFIWVFDINGRVVWDIDDAEEFDDLLVEYGIPRDHMEC